MKLFRYVFVFVLLGLLAGCYEVNEEIVINADGTGTYVTKMDMSQLLEMMQTMAGEEKLTEEGMDRVIDTTFQIKDMLGDAKDITPEQKALLSTGIMKMQMNVKEKIFKMNTRYPISNQDNLQKLMSGQGNSVTGLTEIFKKFFGPDKTPPEDSTQIVDAAKEPDMQDISNIFDVTVKNGFISKKVNNIKYKTLLGRPEMGQIKQLSSTGMEISYTTTIRLPRPVKTSDNPLIKLSEDKKTVTMHYNMLELLDNPEKFSYTLEY